MLAIMESCPSIQTDFEGFAVVKRKNNPLRSEALVHKSLGKIASVEPAESLMLASRLAHQARFPWDWPVIGLSESSILLGRLVAENQSGSRFIYSTRYPEPGMVPFDEPHSHAPAHYINLKRMEHIDRICIVEDEVTSGNTVMNLIRVLAANLKHLHRVHLIALKVMCTDRRIHEMKDSAQLLGIHLSMGWLHREYLHDNEPLQVWPNPVSDNSQTAGEAIHSQWEKGRGRLEPFTPEVIQARYEMWRSKINHIEPGNTVICIGASEAIDLAYELAHVCSERFPAFFHHLTMSPWDLPGWSFHQEGKRTLFLYNLPYVRACYFLVYDQPFQCSQMESLGMILRLNSSQVFMMRPGEKDVHFDEL